MDKSPEAFRTISEVADLLETPAHVLRFWESRFPQIRPVKRAGGRRYYRPADVALLSGIKRLLHDEGLTIRGVQKMLREQGVRHVAGLADEGYDATEGDGTATLEAALVANFPEDAPPEAGDATRESAKILPLDPAGKAPVRPRRPVQENLFSGLFDDMSPPVAAPEPAPEPEPDQPVFAEVTEALAMITPDAPPEEVPEAPMMVDAEEIDLTERIATLTAPTAEPESPPDSASAPAGPAFATGSLAARLSGLPRARKIAHRETLRALRARLIALEDRMAPARY